MNGGVLTDVEFCICSIGVRQVYFLMQKNTDMMLSMLRRILHAFHRRREHYKLCKAVQYLLPQGNALRAFLEETTMLIKVERSLRGSVSKETLDLARGLMLTLMLREECSETNRNNA